MESFEEFLERFASTYKSKSMEVSYRCNDGLGQVLELSQTRDLSSILIETIRNSEQAGSKEFRIETERDTNYLYITISDDGPGIPLDMAGSVFAYASSTKGSKRGRGLFLAQLLVRKYHGEIEIGSDKGRGTMFKIRFPVGMPVNKEVAEYLQVLPFSS